HGLVAILDLHWTDGFDKGPGVSCPDSTAACQKSMADAAHAPVFWTSVAKTFRDDQATVFDLFNEPFLDVSHALPKAQAWRCWRNGGDACPGFSFRVAGMQSLVDAVRATGARNVLMLGGLSWSLDLTGWLKHKPRDPTGNLAAAWHVYNFNACTASCWKSNVAAVAKVVPVVAGEIGEDDCRHVFVDQLMPWLDAHRVSYLGWTWNTYAACKGHPILIKDYNGTPSTFGAGIKAHLAKVSHR
ncbi:MAG: cellulase family glycosylhydrolase, partial [Mycobacteriales bacterium]